MALTPEQRKDSEETSAVWAKVLGKYDTEFAPQGQPVLWCLTCGHSVDYVSDGDTLLTQALRAFEHEKENHA